MKHVEIYAEATVLGAGSQSRAGCCALLGFNGYWKAVGQYLGQGVSEMDAVGIAIELALDSLKELCAVTIYTTGQQRSAAGLPLFQSFTAITRQALAPSSHSRQIAAQAAAYEIALGCQCDEFILKHAVESVPEVPTGLIVSTQTFTRRPKNVSTKTTRRKRAKAS
jgi:hypothetical protein